MTDSLSNPPVPARSFPATLPVFAAPPPPPGSNGRTPAAAPSLALYEHDPSSRELLLGWCFWLLGSWFVLGLGLDGTPVRWMIFSAMIGMLMLWPLFRLSQDGFLSPRRRWKWYEPAAGGQGQTQVQDPVDEPASADAPAAPLPRLLRSRLSPWLVLRDWFSLNVVFQAVVWPHLLTGKWTGEQALWVDAVVAGWSLLVGAIVAWGCQSSRGLLRFFAMLLVLGVLLFEPLMMSVINQISEARATAGATWRMHVSPIEALYAVTQPAEKFYVQPWIVPIVCVALAAVLAWIGLLWLTRTRTAKRAGLGQAV
ncbi:MAG: hypothetical protein WD768_06635 [Phycisphaeraceae bacterium]